ncbi:hypothetical protein F0U61_52760 [Archangium violaceum]|uniref:hypothetical protein n=1 Tax=Archangium violaceum TaxID=83451 RepID=UPI002B2B0BC8|nr:hypothetical protein F0U61_52760 [Archangium violaceum]
MRGRWWGLLLCLGACGPVAEVSHTREDAPVSGIPDTGSDDAPEPDKPEPHEDTGGVHLWTREAEGSHDFWKVQVALNDAGLTGMLAAFAMTPTDPNAREYSSIELLGWDAEGHEQWRRQVPGKAPNDMDYLPWNYALNPRGDGFFVVNSRERFDIGSNIDFGCTERVGQPEGNDRLLFLDAGGRCTRDLRIQNIILGAAVRGSDVWISRECFGCAGTYWPPLQHFDASGQVAHERPIEWGPAPETELLHDGRDTLLAWSHMDTRLSRQSERFDELWARELPLRILAAPAVRPDGTLAVVGARLPGQGVSFGTSTLPEGNDLVLLRLSTGGEPLGAVGTGIPEPHWKDNPLLLATDSAGVVIVSQGDATRETRVLSLSWEGNTRWTWTLEPWVPGDCQPSVTSVATHPRYGVRLAGTLSGRNAGEGSCETPRKHLRLFVMALKR